MSLNPNIEIIEVTPANEDELLKKFESGSALTFEGVRIDEAHLYRDFFKQFTEVDATKPCYIIYGRTMNNHYGLIGRNAYANDLNILVFPLDTFQSIVKIAVPRFQIGGRWFDDIVNNNRRNNRG